MSNGARGTLWVVGGAIVTAAALLVVCAGVVVAASAPSSRGVDVRPLRGLAQRSTIRDAAGNVIGRLGLRDRQDVPIESVPKVMQNAVVAAEDATFWTNRGIDLKGLGRAAIDNLKSGAIVQGGSTITQQLVKNRVLSSKRTATRKIREIALALAYAKRYSKKDILEQYLNTVYFGQGAYGVQAAAERFFQYTALDGETIPGELSKLTLAQAALLAGLISNPEGYNPFTHPQAARERRSLILDRMVEQGYATRAEADAAAHESLPTLLPAADLRPTNAWVEEVQDTLLRDPRFAVLGNTPQERERRLLTGGLTVDSTKDPRIQAAADEAIVGTLPDDHPDFAAALVAIDPATGAVRAMTTGRDFQQSQYNIATTTPGRQAGSTWKTITLAAALTQGMSPYDMVDGSSPCVFPGLLGSTDNAEPGEGLMTLRDAAVNSVNCAFARTELTVGFPPIIDLAHKMGIRQTTLQPILTLTLGTIETTPLEMATVSATLANGGVRHWPYFVQRITDDKGRVIYDSAGDPGERVLSPDVVACETDILRDVVRRGTGTNAQLAGGRPVAGKTGTTDGRSDANFLGFTPNLAAFVWYGNPNARTPGAGYGGQVPARVFKAFMDQALDGTDATPFPDPGPVCARPSTRPVPEQTVNPAPVNPQRAPAPSPAPAAPPPTPKPTTPPPTPQPTAPAPTPTTARSNGGPGTSSP